MSDPAIISLPLLAFIFKTLALVFCSGAVIQGILLFRVLRKKNSQAFLLTDAAIFDNVVFLGLLPESKISDTTRYLKVPRVGSQRTSRAKIAYG